MGTGRGTALSRGMAAMAAGATGRQPWTGRTLPTSRLTGRFRTHRRASPCSAARGGSSQSRMASVITRTFASSTRCVHGRGFWGLLRVTLPRASSGQISGASVCNYSLTAPLSLAFSPTTGRLWAVEGATVVSAFDIPADCDASPLTPALTLPRGAVVLAGGIAVGLRTDRLYVVDMETSQVKIFDGATGALVVAVGRVGGYADGNTTTSVDKLWLLPSVFGTVANASHFSRGSFVVVDDAGDVACG